MYSPKIQQHLTRRNNRAHGGETDDLHSAIVGLRERIDQKWIEFELAKSEERRIWETQIARILALIPNEMPKEEAEEIVFKKISDVYDCALKEAQRFFGEWLELMKRYDFLAKQELAEIEADISNAK